MSAFKNILFVLVVIALGHIEASQFSFDGYRLVRVTPREQSHVELVGDLEGTPDFDVWNSIKGVNSTIDVALSPSAYVKYSKLFSGLRIPFVVLNNNIQSIFDEQQRSMEDNSRNTNIVGKYASHPEINSFIDTLAATNPAIVSSYVAGKTYEGRNLKVIVLKTASSKRKVWIDCGIHAREWVSPSTCIWFIDSLLTKYAQSDFGAQALLKYFEFHILPVVNPDGYEYSRSSYRMWRKNRARNAGSSCMGVDLNRNWGYMWRTGGSSAAPCDDTYAGPKQDSELETQAIESALLAHKGQWDAYITMHSYGNWWFSPFGFTKLTTGMSNYVDLIDKAKIGVAALKTVNGLTMTYGPSAQILYVASGGSEDWAYAVAGAKYAYCLELRPGQTGTDANYGFALPQDRAPLAGAETYVGITAFLRSIIPA